MRPRRAIPIAQIFAGLGCLCSVVTGLLGLVLGGVGFGVTHSETGERLGALTFEPSSLFTGLVGMCALVAGVIGFMAIMEGQYRKPPSN